MSKPKYLTFPIALLKDSRHCIKQKIDGVFDYCLFDAMVRNGCGAEEAARTIGVKFGKIDRALKNGEMLHNSIPDNYPKTSISKSLIFDFYLNSKTEFEIDCFLCFAGIRSILQRKPFAKVVNSYILTRMAGNAGVNDELPEWISKYQQRYHLDKVKTELQLNWGLKIYSTHVRGNYVSFTLELKELVYHAELKRKKYREKQLNDQKKEAERLAKQSIYGNNTNTAPIKRDLQ